MPQIQVLKAAWDGLDPSLWAEMVEDFHLPVGLGVPAELPEDEDKLVYVCFDDPRVTEDQALAVIGAIGGL